MSRPMAGTRSRSASRSAGNMTSARGKAIRAGVQFPPPRRSPEMRLITLALCGAVLLQAPKGAQPTFKSATELVEVDAVVLDHDGNFVPGLTPEHITLYENGRPQK